MAVLANITADNVGRVLAVGNCAVMTAGTGAEYVKVINASDRCPDCVVVTVFANIGGIDMLGILAGCRAAVVTPGTGRDNRAVIKIGRQPAIGGMAVFANVIANNMILMFAVGNCTVMTA